MTEKIKVELLIGFGSFISRYGFTDPDQNETDLQHCVKETLDNSQPKPT